MSPRNYHSKQRMSEYVAHPNFINTVESKVEKDIELFVYRVLRSILFIPRRFLAALRSKLSK
jgi:hypothetical protein